MDFGRSSDALEMGLPWWFVSQLKLRTGFDSVASEHQDLLTVHGLLQALRDCMRLSSKGVLWGGVPCCTFLFSHSMIVAQTPRVGSTLHGGVRFVFMACSRTGRYVDIMGNDHFDEVRVGNILSARFALLALICMCFNRHWIATCHISNVTHAYSCMDADMHMLRWNNQEAQCFGGLLT